MNDFYDLYKRFVMGDRKLPMQVHNPYMTVALYIQQNFSNFVFGVDNTFYFLF